MPENNLFGIKKRVTAVNQTRKITRTMELIASSRLQRGKVLFAGHQEWAMYIREAARCLPDSYFKPFPNPAGDGQKAYIVFGGDKGFSGSYSPNLLQYAEPIVNGHLILAVGTAAESYFPGSHSILSPTPPSISCAAAIVEEANTVYENNEIDEVYMIYAKSSKHITERLFPLLPLERRFDKVIIEPSAETVFPTLLRAYAESVVYEVHLHAFIAEQIARVAAMDNATKNADEIHDILQATYNRIRQSNITQEITGVANSAEGG